MNCMKVSRSAKRRAKISDNHQSESSPKHLLKVLSPANLLTPCWNIVMMTHPGATFAVRARQGVLTPYIEYFVATLPLSHITHVADSPNLSKSIPIAPPEDTMPYVFEPEMSETTNTRPPSDFSPRVTAPLGYIVHAHSDDKRTDCNVGFYVRNADEYPSTGFSLSLRRAVLQNYFKMAMMGNESNDSSRRRSVVGSPVFQRPLRYKHSLKCYRH